MADILTPPLGESVSEATVAKWSKKAGESVKKDELILELETDKVSLEVVAPSDGVLTIDAAEGDHGDAGPEAGLGRWRQRPARRGHACRAAARRRRRKPAAAAAPAGEAQPEPVLGKPAPREAAAGRRYSGAEPAARPLGAAHRHREQARSHRHLRHRQGRPFDQGRRPGRAWKPRPPPRRHRPRPPSPVWRASARSACA